MNFKTQILFLLFHFIFHSNLFAQSNTEIKINSVFQNGNKINIRYDVKTKWFLENSATLYAKRKGSKYWEGPLESTYGNINDNIIKGENLVTWNVTNDREQFTGQWVFGIDNKISVKKNIKNLKITCGILSLAGFALGTYGYLKSEEYYNQYQTATTNASQARENDIKMSTLGIISGSLGAVFLIENMILRKKIKKVKRSL